MADHTGAPLGAPEPAGSEAAPNPVEVGFPAAAPQRRLTVAFRVILLVPHFIALYVLGIAAEVVAVIGWFGALVTGRLPGFAAEYLTGYLRWYARVLGYFWLLTDVYPPFQLAGSDYPVRVVTRPGPLNRLAVLFRVILVVPAAVVSALLVYGLHVLTLAVVWLIVLVTGEMPRPLHQALSAVLRWLVRYQGYSLMLTSQYPSGLFGDLARGSATYGPGVASGDPPWQLHLPDLARKLVVAILAWGGLVVIGAIIGGAVAASAGGSTAPGTRSRTHAIRSATSAQRAYARSVLAFSAGMRTCGSGSAGLKCVKSHDARLAGALVAFAGGIRSIAMPTPRSRADAGALAEAAGGAARVFQRLSTATSLTQYQSLVVSSHLVQALDEVNSDYARLSRDLS